MQAPGNAARRRSHNVSDRLPERMPVPVLGLELAARQPPSPRPGPYQAGRPTAPYQVPAARPPQAPPPALTTGRRGLMLAVCCMSLFMVGLDNTIVNVGLPDIGRDLHSGVSGLQWTVAAYTIALAALLMFAGSLADRIGRRTIFQVGLSLFTLGSWLCSLAPGLGWLIGFRILDRKSTRLNSSHVEISYAVFC